MSDEREKVKVEYNGETVILDVPVGMPEDEIRQKFMAKMQSGQMETGASLEGVKKGLKAAYEGTKDFSEGIGVSALKLWQGAKDILPGMEVTESDKETLKAWQDAAGESFMGAGGELAGDLASYAIPAAGPLKAARTAKELMNAGKQVNAFRRALATKNAPLMTDVASVAAVEGLKIPEQGETRLGNMTEASAYGWLGAGGYVLGRTLASGAKGSDLLNKLRGKGFKPTVGQAIPKLSKVENIAAYVPPFARGVALQRADSALSVHKMALDDAASPSAASIKSLVRNKGDDSIEYYKPDKIGHEGVKQLEVEFGKAYKEAYPLIRKLDKSYVQDVGDVFSRYENMLSGQELKSLRYLADDLSETISKNQNGSYQIIKQKLDKAYSKDKNLGLDRAIDDLKDVFTKAMPERNKVALALIDKQYGKFASVANAAGTEAAMGRTVARGSNIPWYRRQDVYEGGDVHKAGIFTLDELVGGTKAATKTKYGAGTGDAPMQKFINTTKSAIPEQIGALPVLGVRVAQAIPNLGTKRLGDQIAGNYKYQKAIRDALQRYRDETPLPYLVSPYRFGAAYLNEE